MNETSQRELKERYLEAVESFVSKVKDDPNVVALIVSGSLAYDVVWEKSDIDMTVIVRDQPLKNDSYCITEDGITINAYLMPRSMFKREMEACIGGSFGQSYFSNGMMVYTTDNSLKEYFDDIKKIGTGDIALSAFEIAMTLIYLYEKSLKWLRVRKDPLYAQYFLLKAAEVIAQMELCLNGRPLGRDSIQKALMMNPEMIAPFYGEAMSRHLTENEILKAIEKMDCYLMRHMDIWAKPAIDFMAGGEIKTVTLIAKHFHRKSHFVINLFEYMADKGVIEKVSQTIRITPRSKMAVEELGFIHIL